MTAFTLRDGYDKTKFPKTAMYRPMSIEEAKLLNYADRVTFRSLQGAARVAKVNGAPKTWKRDAQRVEVPCKYGMYEYGTFYSRPDGTVQTSDGAMLVVPI